MTSTLDPFQARLLAELREVVAAGDVPSVRSARPRGRLLAVAALAASAVAGVVIAPALLGSDPAYAVVPGANGALDVTVHRLEDAAGLERALARYGVRADVSYLPAGRACADGRFRPATAPDPDAMSRYTFGGDGYRVQLDPGAIADDQTIVIAVSRIEPGGVHGQLGIAEGPVLACRPIPYPSR